MSFFKSSGYDALKLFLTQFALSIFGMVTVSATLNNSYLMLGAGVLGVLLYVLVVYDNMWNVGGSDRIKVDAKRAEKDFLKPVLIALTANIPNFVFSAVTLISYFIGDKADGVYLISNAILRFLQAFYMGFFKNIVINGVDLNQNPFTYTVTPFFSVFIIFITYVLGYKGIALLPAKKNKKQ